MTDPASLNLLGRVASGCVASLCYLENSGLGIFLMLTGYEDFILYVVILDSFFFHLTLRLFVLFFFIENMMIAFLNCFNRDGDAAADNNKKKFTKMIMINMMSIMNVVE